MSNISQSIRALTPWSVNRWNRKRDRKRQRDRERFWEGQRGTEVETERERQRETEGEVERRWDGEEGRKSDGARMTILGVLCWSTGGTVLFSWMMWPAGPELSYARPLRYFLKDTLVYRAEDMMMPNVDTEGGLSGCLNWWTWERLPWSSHFPVFITDNELQETLERWTDVLHEL